MCLNFFHFTYDVEFPLQVMIRDDEAFNRQGFVFTYMLPVVIKSNQGNKVDFGLDVFEDIKSFQPKEECDQLTGPSYDIRVKGFEDGLYTDLKDVNLSYDCIQASCTLGKTRLDGGAYRLRTQLPSFCSSGFLVAQKQGYLEQREQVLDSTDITIDIRKLREFTFSVKKHSVSGDTVRQAEEIPKNHKAIISVQSFAEPDLVSFAEYPGDDPLPIKIMEDNSVYAVDILYVDELDNVILGGYKGNWTITIEELQDADEIVFHVAQLTRPINESQTFGIIKFLEENQNYKTELKPEFK